MKSGDVGVLSGCAFVLGIILIKVAAIVVIIYVAWHFISKYW